MKTMKKVLALVVAMMVIVAMSSVAMAQEAGTGTDGTITITNAAKGIDYAAYKLFNASVSSDGSTIRYTGDIPSGLTNYFQKDNAGNIHHGKMVDGTFVADTVANAPADLTADEIAALTDWAKTASAAASAKSDGSQLTFKVDFGYYVVTTSQGETAISVTSTKPNATIVDKNSTPPVNELSKSADETDVYIGQTVTYTVKFKTANFSGEGEAAKQIIEYTITDTPATGSLEDIAVTKITIGGTEYKVDGAVPQFTSNAITIPWATGSKETGFTALYDNGAEIVITYTATVADTAAIAGEGNTNTVEISFKDEDNQEHKDPDHYKDTETIKTYAIALKKVDQAGQALEGAEFQLPFYVKSEKAEDGAYIYAGTESGDGLTNKVTSPADGIIIVKGVKSGSYSITETKAPAGYNDLSAPVSIEAEELTATTTNTTTYLDPDGNVIETATETSTEVKVEISELAASAKVVVNKSGATLPSTGGMGTTILYTVGGILVLGAAILLVVRRRVGAGK